MKKITCECCETTEVHEELLALVREKMPQEEALYDLSELFKVTPPPQRAQRESGCAWSRQRP